MALDVLIVDDSAAIRKILQRVLHQAEIPLGKIYEAGDGQDGLEVLKANAVGLVLTDINMPRMDGLRFLAEIRGSDSWRKLPVIMITTEGGEAAVGEALRLGATAYLRKPFTADQIREKLSTILGLQAR